MDNDILESVIRVVEANAGSVAKDIVIGEHIRFKSDLISDYCLARSERVFEDLATIVESVAYCDRRIVRRSSSGWKRNLSIDLPVYELSTFQSSPVLSALCKAVEFLTGDR